VVDGTVTWQIRKIGSGGGEAIGVIKAFAGNGDIPSGYLLCDGSAVSRTMYPDLFSAIGTTYGSGDGSTTFNVPDYNTAQRFAQGGTVAGTVKEAGLPNIEGASLTQFAVRNTSASYVNVDVGEGAISVIPQSDGKVVANGGNYYTAAFKFNASKFNPIYGNSDTVQPNSLTVRYIIKAFDGQTADSALIDITQYAQELAGKANINGSNMVHHKDIITTSGTYTAPVTGLYKITVKGGGGGGAKGTAVASTYARSGAGGGEGGSTIGFEHMIVGDTATVVIGAGGAGATTATGYGVDGGNSSVTINLTTYTGGGGQGGVATAQGGNGGTGDIPGASGSPSNISNQGSQAAAGGSGGGNGSGITATSGAGGRGGISRFAGTTLTIEDGSAGGDGYVWFEYTSSV
jgi:microcystin-dependent protein